MACNSNPESWPGLAVRDFRSNWRILACTDLVFKVLAFILLAPLVSLLFRLLLSASGSAVLSDLDIVHFFLGPLGWLCLILVGASWLAIVALEQSSLLGILSAQTAGQRMGVIGSLRFATSHAWPVLLVTGRIVIWTLLVAAPFLAVAFVTYVSLLTEYDINYYLKEKPPAFGIAIGIGAVLGIALTAILLRLFTGWFYALPLVIFEGVAPADVLRVSADRARGHRRQLLIWIVGWGVGVSLLSVAGTGLVGIAGRVFVPSSTASLHLLATAIGLTLLIWTVVSLGVNLLGSTTFSALMFRLYLTRGTDRELDPTLWNPDDSDVIARRLRLTPKRLAMVGVIGVATAVAVGVIAVHSVQPEDHVQIMAHRGASKAAPENTMAAFQRAIDDGADWIELDVQETSDGEIVVFHDSDFMKVAGNNLKIWDATLEDLQDIDIGSWFSPDFQDQRVPTLGDVLDLCRGEIRVNIELKYYGHDEQLEQRVVDVVEAHNMADDIVLMSLKADGVRKMKSIRPDWNVGLLMSVAVGDLQKLDADFLAVNASFVDRHLVRTAHSAGKEIYVWTVNDAPSMSTMIGRGVDGLLTDKPALARTVLVERAKMSVVERLLLELATLLGTSPEMGEP